MFVRNGEKLGSILVDVDPSDAEEQARQGAKERKAAVKKVKATADADEFTSVPAPIGGSSEFLSPLSALTSDSSESEQSEPETAEAEADEEEVEVPAHSAVKADWVDFAVSQGLDREEAEGYTKQELIDEFGG